MIQTGRSPQQLADAVSAGELDLCELPVADEPAIREFFRDAQGRMWYGTAPNNKVGYFYLAGKSGAASAAGK